MMYNLFLEYKFNDAKFYRYENYYFKYIIEEEKHSFLFNTVRIKIRIVNLDLSNDHVFPNVLNKFAKYIKENYENKNVKCRIDWFVFLDNSDLFLFEKLSSKKNNSQKGIRNYVWLFNEKEKILYWQPDTIQNRVINARIQFLENEWNKADNNERNRLINHLKIEYYHLFDLIMTMH